MTYDKRNRRKSESNYELHMQWKKYISCDHPELTKGINRGVLLAYCHLLANSGGHGVRCFASDTTIGIEMELGRDTVAKYKREALRLGWFTATGQFGPHAAPIFDIAIPEHDPIPFDPNSKPVRKSNLGEHLNNGAKKRAKPPVDETDHLADSGADKWADCGTPVVKGLWGEAAMAEQAAREAKRVVDDSAAPVDHSGAFPIDCPRCQWYTINRHPKTDQVHDEHPFSGLVA